MTYRLGRTIGFSRYSVGSLSSSAGRLCEGAPWLPHQNGAPLCEPSCASLHLFNVLSGAMDHADFFFEAARNRIVESASAIAYILRLLGGSPGERSMEDVFAVLAAGAATHSRPQSVSSFEDYLGDGGRSARVYTLATR